MNHIPWCSLCGGDFVSRTRTPESPHWASLVRAVRAEIKQDESIPTVELTGRGAMRGTELVAPPYGQGMGVSPETEKTYPIVPDDESYRTFAFHEICWRFLMHLIEEIRGTTVDGRKVGTWLFHIMDTFAQTGDGSVLPSNIHHGGLSLRASAHNHRILLDDIREPIPPQNDRKVVPACFFQDRLDRRPGVTKDPFGKIPQDITCEILSWMSSPDIHNLRLASRAVAIRSSPPDLPQSFWVSRFSSNREMGFAFALSRGLKSSETNWYAVYRFISQCLEETACRNGGIANRCRVWKCVQDYANTLAVLLEFEETGGSIPPYPHRRAISCGLGQMASSLHVLSGAEHENPYRVVYYNDGCRDYEYIPFSKYLASYSVRLQVSTIQLGGSIFISGFRVSIPTDHGYETVDEFGTPIPSEFTTIDLAQGAEVLHIVVYLSQEGINGFELIIKQPDGSIKTESAGDLEIRDCFKVVTKLESRCPIWGFVAEFDSLKLLSLQLLERPWPDDPSETNAPLPTNKLWNPKLRSEVDLSPYGVQWPVSKKVFPVHFDAPFGGPDGSRLSSLNKVTVYMNMAFAFHGMAFSYDDGTELLCGSKSNIHHSKQMKEGIAQSVMINGRLGERIIKISYASELRRSEGSSFMRILEVKTNFNHVFAFLGRNSRRAGGRPFDVKEFDEDKVFASPPDSIPIRMTILVGAPTWVFEAIVFDKFIPVSQDDIANSAATDLVHTTPSLPRIEHTETGKFMIQNSGACFSRASLSDVCGIRVSTAPRDTFPCESRISGLLFEYGQSRHSAIVGQWVRESAFFPLKPGDKIVEIRLMYSDDVYYDDSFEKYGQVVGVWFRTRAGMRFNVGPTTTRGGYEVSYYATPFEDMREIVWIHTFESDDVQFYLKEAHGLQGGKLIFHHRSYLLRNDCFPNSDTRTLTVPPGEPPNHQPMPCTMKLCHRRPRHALFWHEHDGVDEVVRRLHQVVFFHGEEKQDILVGMVFQYEGGVTRGFGLTTARRSVLDLSDGDEIAYILVYTYDALSKGFEFITQGDRRLRATRADLRPDFVHCFALTTDYEVGNQISQTLPDIGPIDLVSVVLPPPGAGRCVGLWASADIQCWTRGMFQIEEMGPIFDPNLIDDKATLA